MTELIEGLELDIVGIVKRDEKRMPRKAMFTSACTEANVIPLLYCIEKVHYRGAIVRPRLKYQTFSGTWRCYDVIERGKPLSLLKIV